jgi:hypothetical protein
MLLVAMLMTGGAEAATAQGPGVAPSLCRVVEGLPSVQDPVRQSRAFRSTIRKMNRDLEATSRGKALAVTRAKKHLVALERALAKTLSGAHRAFHLSAGKRWNSDRQARAKRFLGTHVLTRDAVLRVGEYGFEPSPTVRALLLWSACWAGDLDSLVRYGRGATRVDEGGARALAALALHGAHRVDEALELVDSLGGEGFLVAWALGIVAPDPETRRRERAFARRRAEDQWQRQISGAPQPMPQGD